MKKIKHTNSPREELIDASLARMPGNPAAYQWFTDDEREKVKIWLFCQLASAVEGADRAKRAMRKEGGEVMAGQLLYFRNQSQTIENLLHQANKGVMKKRLLPVLVAWDEIHVNYKPKPKKG